MASFSVTSNSIKRALKSSGKICYPTTQAVKSVPEAAMHKLRKILRLPRLGLAVARYLGHRLLVRLRLRHVKTPAGIGLVVDSFSYGGLEQVVLNLYRGYRAHHQPAYIISVSNQVSDMIQGIEDDPRHLRILHWRLADLIDFCRENNIRTLHYHYSTYHLPIMRLLGLKTIYTIHNTFVWFNPRAWLRTRFQLRFANRIIAVSNFCCDYFCQKTGFKPSRVKVIINGIDTTLFAATKQRSTRRKVALLSAAPTRQKLGLKPSDFVYVNVASFNEQKHQLALVGALEQVLKTRPGAKLVLVGNIGAPGLYHHIKKVIDRSPARHAIKIIEYLPQDALSEFLKTVPDAFVLPSIYEAGVPLSVMEALLVGLPVLMTDFNVPADFPLGRFITPLKPPYHNLADLSIRDIQRMTRSKRTKNQTDIVAKMLAVKSRHGKARRISQSEINRLSTEQMVKSYMQVIKELHERRR